MAEKLTGTYVSACGAVRNKEIFDTQALLPERLQQIALYGIQISPTTLLGGFNKRGPKWYPNGTSLLRSVCLGTEARTSVHINPHNTHSTHVRSLVDSVLGILATASCDENGTPCLEYPISALQLNNLDWTSDNWSSLVTHIQRLGIAVILQANSGACKVSPEDFARAAKYQNPDYLLLDTSGGRGESFNADSYARIIEAVQKIGGPAIAIAGGLGPDVSDLANFYWLQQRFDNLSADAESKLRDGPKEFMSKTTYSPQKAAQFIIHSGVV